MEKSFRHSGKLGDIIYSLPAVRAMGGGKLLLQENAAIGDRLTTDLRCSMAELLRMQPYITAVEDFRDQTDFVDLDAFRRRPLTENLAEQHLRTFDLDPREKDTRWLWVDRPELLPARPVVIHRSKNLHDPEFPWPAVYLKYAKMAVFVGTPDEHRDFVAKFGDIQYQPTATLADLARLIAGCELFIGNQSCPFAIAEGLKANAIQETSRVYPNCLFSRSDAAHSITGPLQLPDLTNSPAPDHPTIGGPENNAPIFGFMHVAMVNHWKQIVDEQLLKLKVSGLWEKTERLFVGLLGPRPEELPCSDRKIVPMYFGVDYSPAELPTLAALQRFCRARDCLAYYIHSKGVFSPSNGTRDWRHSMEHFIITRHEDCIAALADHDICGINWHSSWCRFFGGNFWWARADYLRTLPDIRSIESIPGWDHSQRHVCERWIGENPAVRAASLHESRTHHYRDEYPRSRYAHVREVPPNEAFDYSSDWRGVENRFQDLIEPVTPVRTIVVVGLDPPFILFALASALPEADVIGIEQCPETQATATNGMSLRHSLETQVRSFPNILLEADASAATFVWDRPIDVLVINNRGTPERMRHAFEQWEPRLRASGCAVLLGIDRGPPGLWQFLQRLPGRNIELHAGGGIGAWYKTAHR